MEKAKLPQVFQSMTKTMNIVSMSTGCLPRLEGSQFYELSSVVRMMKQFLKNSEVDGFEFVLLPEWGFENPPLTPTSAPLDCEKHSVNDIIEELHTYNFPIISVHANRDIGNYLCSEKAEEINKGIGLVEECLSFTKKVNSRICVFHFWDTWKKSLDLACLQALYQKFEGMFPEIEISVENIPTKCEGKTPFQLVRSFRHKTLDLKWASLFDEFDAFVEIIQQVDNVHIQGKYQDGNLVPSVGNLDYERALKCIREAGYSGAFTIELEGRAEYGGVLRYIDKLKRCTS
jgi:sugar phosphate isomerase/epimerase